MIFFSFALDSCLLSRLRVVMGYKLTAIVCNVKEKHITRHIPYIFENFNLCFSLVHNENITRVVVLVLCTTSFLSFLPQWHIFLVVQTFLNIYSSRVDTSIVVTVCQLSNMSVDVWYRLSLAQIALLKKK